jgi:hypothetical protein
MKHPSCDRDPSECRIVSRGGSSTLLAWSPVYDGNGKRIDKGDPNTHTVEVSCGACGRQWTESTRYGETTIQDA